MAELCPDVERVRVVHNDYENTAILDKSLRDLEMFPASESGDLHLEIDMNNMNMLFLIQLDNIAVYGRHLTKVSFTQCDFLHPQSLNPFAKHCPNLTSISLYGCADVTDEMFVGEVPELTEKPFLKLKELIVEGHFPALIAQFLIGSCSNVEHLKLHTTKTFESHIFYLLSRRERKNLSELHLTVHDAEEDFVPCLLYTSPSPRDRG